MEDTFGRLSKLRTHSGEDISTVVAHAARLNVRKIKHRSGLSSSDETLLGMIASLRASAKKEWGKKPICQLNARQMPISSDPLDMRSMLAKEWLMLLDRHKVLDFKPNWAREARSRALEDFAYDACAIYRQGNDASYYDVQNDIFWLQGCATFAPCMGIVDPSAIPPNMIRDAGAKARDEIKQYHSVAWVEENIRAPLHRMFCVAHFQEQLKTINLTGCLPALTSPQKVNLVMQQSNDDIPELPEEAKMREFFESTGEKMYSKLYSMNESVFARYEEAVDKLRTIAKQLQLRSFADNFQALSQSIDRIIQIIESVDVQWVSKIASDSDQLKITVQTLREVKSALPEHKADDDDDPIFAVYPQFWKAHRLKTLHKWGKQEIGRMVKREEHTPFNRHIRDQLVVSDLIAITNGSAADEFEQMTSHFHFEHNRFSAALRNLKNYIDGHFDRHVLEDIATRIANKLRDWIAQNDFDLCPGYLNSFKPELQEAVEAGLKKIHGQFSVPEVINHSIRFRTTHDFKTDNSLQQLLVMNQFLLFLRDCQPPRLDKPPPDAKSETPPEDVKSVAPPPPPIRIEEEEEEVVTSQKPVKKPRRRKITTADASSVKIPKRLKATPAPPSPT
jgi:hypothetical protein